MALDDGEEEWLTDDDEPEEGAPTTSYTSLLDAPDYAAFLRQPRTARARDYEDKCRSIFKAAALTSFANGAVYDGATFLDKGPGVASALGNLADVNDKVARGLDLITSPDNPMVIASVMSILLAMQLLRNHEEEAGQVARGFWQARKERKRARRAGETPQKTGFPLTIRGPFGRSWTFRLHVPPVGAILRSRTTEPLALAKKVLSDPKLVRELEKHNIKIVVDNG